MKKRNLLSKFFWGSLVLLPSCSLLALPFQLVGAIFKGLFSLLNSLISAGSSAASQAVKLSPYALFFASAETTPTVDGTMLTVQSDCQPDEQLEKLAQALQNAPIEIKSLDETLAGASPDTQCVVVFDPADLLIPSKQKEILAALQGEQIREVRWVQAPSSELPLKLSLTNYR